MRLTALEFRIAARRLPERSFTKFACSPANRNVVSQLSALRRRTHFVSRFWEEPLSRKSCWRLCLAC